MVTTKGKTASSSSGKKTSPSKFKMGTAKSYSKSSKDQSVYTFCGKPGYATAFAIKHNGDAGYCYPFQRKVDDGDASVDHLNILAVVNRILEGTQTPLTSGKYNTKQFLRQVNYETISEIKEATAEWGREVAVAMNACSYTYPTNFVYRGDISGFAGKDMKDVVQEEDVKNFVRECFHEHLDNDDFFEDAALMVFMFNERDPEVIKNYFSANPDNL